jgi:hypothetical protein
MKIRIVSLLEEEASDGPCDACANRYCFHSMPVF